jgi:hypothetical protein
MASYIHLTNAKGRDATVGLVTLKAAPAPKLGLPGKALVFRRYLAATESGHHTALQARFGSDYSKELISGDPEVDVERVGMAIEETQTVYLDGEGKVMFSEPKFIEVVINADGTEKERRDPVETQANVNGEMPVRWTGKKIPVADAVRRFAFRRSLQLRHSDGLTYDYLFEMAKELEASKCMMLVGSGEKGSGPLVFQVNGRAYRGFLSGKTKDKGYQLTLHLSDMELKQPVTPAEKGTS